MYRLLLLVSLTAAFAGGRARAQGIRPLPVAVSIADSLGPDGVHGYRLDLAADQFVFVEADQQTMDVVLTVFGPGGERVTAVDVTARGPELLTFPTASAGPHRLEVTPFQRQTGRYAVALRRTEPLATTPEGRVDQMMWGYEEDTPGTVVAVVRGGDVAFARGYGLANLEYGTPNTAATPYHVASVSKQFTAFAIALLEREGRLSLDDDVRAYLPEVPAFGPTITLRHLLTHTSGLRDLWDLWVMSGGLMGDVIRQDDFLRLVERQRELNFVPGTEAMYSNTGYTLLAEVVERVTGSAFGDWMEAHVFTPLGMRSTHVHDFARVVPQRAYSYQPGTGGYGNDVLSYANAGPTGLFTTAEDLARWLRNFHTGEVGGPEVLARMQERAVLTDGDTVAFALGLVVDEQRGLRRIWHNGNDAGFRTMLVYYPELDAGVVVLSNVGSFNAVGTAVRVAEAFFEAEMGPRPEARPAAGGPADDGAAADPWAPSGETLAAYAGRYYSEELETSYTIAVEEGRLVARHRRHGDLPLAPMEEDRFRDDQRVLGDVTFERAGDGAVIGLRATTDRIRNLLFLKSGR